MQHMQTRKEIFKINQQILASKKIRTRNGEKDEEKYEKLSNIIDKMEARRGKEHM